MRPVRLQQSQVRDGPVAGSTFAAGARPSRCHAQSLEIKQIAAVGTAALCRAGSRDEQAVTRPDPIARLLRGSDAVRRRKADKGLDLGPLEGWVGFYLRLAQNASFQAFAREARQIQLSPGRFATLMLIGRNPGISQTALSRAVGSDKSTLTFALDDLVRRGFVRRARLRKDRRAYSLALTANGERMLAELTECARRHDRNLDRIIGPRDRATFLKILRRLAEELS